MKRNHSRTAIYLSIYVFLSLNDFIVVCCEQAVKVYLTIVLTFSCPVTLFVDNNFANSMFNTIYTKWSQKILWKAADKIGVIYWKAVADMSFYFLKATYEL